MTKYEEFKSLEDRYREAAKKQLELKNYPKALKCVKRAKWFRVAADCLTINEAEKVVCEVEKQGEKKWK